MKRFLTLLILINLTLSCAQNEREKVFGEWKIISVNNGYFYLNTQTDSISISKHFKEVFTDSLELDNVIKVAKITYRNNVMEFNESAKSGYSIPLNLDKTEPLVLVQIEHSILV